MGISRIISIPRQQKKQEYLLLLLRVGCFALLYNLFQNGDQVIQCFDLDIAG